MVSANYQDSCAFLIHDVARLARKRFDDSVRDLGITQAIAISGGVQNETGVEGDQRPQIDHAGFRSRLL